MKKIYVIRHCEAEGQPPEAPLTEKGCNQALNLSSNFSQKNIERIISSPFKRAIDTIQPFAEAFKIKVETNDKLTERVLSSKNLSDWPEKLSNTFDDMELKYEGGESSQEAMERIVEVVEEVFESEYNNTIIVTHGNLMALLLRYYNNKFGFEDWKNLSNPDVYVLVSENNNVSYKRLW